MRANHIDRNVLSLFSTLPSKVSFLGEVFPECLEEISLSGGPASHTVDHLCSSFESGPSLLVLLREAVGGKAGEMASLHI